MIAIVGLKSTCHKGQQGEQYSFGDTVPTFFLIYDIAKRPGSQVTPGVHGDNFARIAPLWIWPNTCCWFRIREVRPSMEGKKKDSRLRRGKVLTNRWSTSNSLLATASAWYIAYEPPLQPLGQYSPCLPWTTCAHCAVRGHFLALGVHETMSCG